MSVRDMDADATMDAVAMPERPSPTVDDDASEERVQEKDADSGNGPFNPGVPRMGLLHELVFVALMCSAMLLTQVGLAQAVLPLHVIGDSFGVTEPAELSWTVAAYSLTVGIFVLPSGRLGDMYGHKRLLIIGFAWFALWTMIAGFTVYTRAVVFFDVCRALQGIGPATVLTNASAMLGVVYKQGPRKNMAFALFAAVAPTGFNLGGIFAGIFAELAWWPWAYWSMAIVLGVVAVLCVFVVPADEARNPDNSMKFDYLGALTGISGAVLVNFAWNQAAVVGWPDPYTYVLLVVGILLLVCFGFVEGRAAVPLLPNSIWSTSVVLILACISLGWGSFGIWNFYIVQIFQVLRGQTILSSAVNMIPTTFSGLAASIFTALFLPRLGPAVLMILALSSFCVAQIFLATAPIHQTYWANTFLAAIVAPFGMDMSFPAGSIIISDALPPHQQGIAASLVNTVVNFSISLGLGLAGTVGRQVNDGGQNVLAGYRGAFYLGIGLSGLGIGLAVLEKVLEGRREKKVEEEEKEKA